MPICQQAKVKHSTAFILHVLMCMCVFLNLVRLHGSCYQLLLALISDSRNWQISNQVSLHVLSHMLVAIAKSSHVCSARSMLSLSSHCAIDWYTRVQPQHVGISTCKLKMVDREIVAILLPITLLICTIELIIVKLWLHPMHIRRLQVRLTLRIASIWLATWWSSYRPSAHT